MILYLFQKKVFEENKLKLWTVLNFFLNYFIFRLHYFNFPPHRNDLHDTQNRMLFNLFPNKPWFLRVCSTSLLKTLREKEKLLVTSNFSFSHSVFYLFGELSAIFNELEIVVCKLFQFGRVQNLSFGKGLKEKRMPISIFSFFHSVY